MGRRKKKPFINKKEAQTYRLVPRSHQDPLAGDVEESQYVLKPEIVQEGEASATRDDDHLKEQQKFGIFFDDDYDYMQHLRAPGTSQLDMGPVEGGQEGETSTGKQVHLPDELFGHEVATEGYSMDKVLPISGPQPDWDPEVVEALENAEVSSDMDQELEDDFVKLASSSRPFSGTEQNDDAATPWWKGRGDFDYSQPPKRTAEGSCEEAESSSSGAGSTLGSMELDHHKSEKKAARFTEYSMTSSKVPRSEAMTLLDDRFEEFMVGYGDHQLGVGEEEGEGEGEGAELDDPKRSEYEQMLLQMAMDDFEKNFKEMSTGDGEGGDVGRRLEEGDNDGEDGEGSEGEDGEASEGEEEEDGEEEDTGTSGEEGEEGLDLIEVDETPKSERWDCESFLSTYSNLYNHPTKIIEPTKIGRPPKVAPADSGEIKLSKKTGIPLGVIPGPLPKENHPQKGTVSRPRNESKEDKKARRLAMKEDRKQRRADKKATKLAFKAETMKQTRTLMSKSTPMTAVV